MFGSTTLTSRESSPGAQQPDAFIAKLSATGSAVCARSMGGIASDGASGIAVRANRVAVVGKWSDDLSGGASSVLFGVLDATTGVDVIAGRSEGTSTGKTSGAAVAVDDQGRATFTGHLEGTARIAGANLTSAGSTDIFMGQYDASGVAQWRVRFGSSSSDSAQGVAVGPDGDIVLAGFFGGTVSFGGASLAARGSGDIVVTRFTSAGTHKWSRNFGTDWLSTGELADDVAVDTAGNVFVAGSVVPTIDFGTGPLSGITQDPFLLKLSPTGSALWAKRFASTDIWPANTSSGVAAAPDGDVVIAGSFKFDIVIDGHRHRNGNDNAFSSADGFVARFGP